MYNSTILSAAEKFIIFMINAYKESLFNKNFEKLDKFLKESALNSKIIGLFISKRRKSFFEDSKVFGIIVRILNFTKRFGKAIGSWIKGSSVVKMTETAINQTLSKPFRIIGVFAVSFLAANISFGVILHRESRTLLIAKLVLFVVSLFIASIKVNFRKVLKDSKFYEIFQWIIEVEK